MQWIIVQSIINGLLMGGIYGLVAMGISLIFGVMKFVNFAMGEFLVLGMYATWLLTSALGDPSPYAMIVPVALIMFIFGMAVFHIVVKPVVGSSGTSMILLTVGLSFFLQNMAQIIWTADYHTVVTDVTTKTISIGEYSIVLPRLIAFGCVLVIAILIDFFLRRTDLGISMRATAENREIAEMLGINTLKIYTIAFALGAMLAGVTGLLVTPIYYIYPGAGNAMKTMAMLIVVMGGMGNVKGAFLCGLISGVAEQLVGNLISLDLAPAGIFVLFLFVLFFKPQGLFGRLERKG